jgi:hypothetical protein
MTLRAWLRRCFDRSTTSKAAPRSRRPSLEALETRDLLSGITIDTSWLAQRGPGPYVLDQANTTYQLATDIDVPGTAFVAAAPGVTLNLNGHTVTYGDSAPITLNNGGFEQGSGPTDVPGWDVSGAPNAIRLPARTGMWGNWMLHIDNFTTAQTIVSSAVAIPSPGREYAATITPKASSAVQSVVLQVVDSVTGQVLSSASSSNAQRGYGIIAQFTPTTTNPVLLKVIVTPTPGMTGTVDLDYAAVTTSRDYGIVATTTYKGALPSQLQWLPSYYNKAANFTVENGTIVQGQGRAASSADIYAKSLPGLDVENVTGSINGQNSMNVFAQYAGNVTVHGSTFNATVDNITNRMLIFAAIYLDHLTGSAVVDSNQIYNAPMDGVFAYNNPDGSTVNITNNIIQQNTRVTDAYGISINGLQNFRIIGNNVDPINGRGLIIDGWSNAVTKNGEIANNYFAAREVPNLEYAYNGLEATAFRTRDYDGAHVNLNIHNNTFYAVTGPGGVWAAIAVRLNQQATNTLNIGANNLFANNYVKAIVTTTNSSYRAFAFSLSGLDAGTGLQINSNTFESNDTSLTLGDNTSYGLTDQDVTFLSNTIRKSTDGALRAYTSVLVGYMKTAVHNVNLIGSIYDGGATSNLVFTDVQTKDINVGVLLTVSASNYYGAPVAGAQIQVFDKTGGLVASGVTDAGGRVQFSVITYKYSQTTTSSQNITTDKRGPFLVRGLTPTGVATQNIDPTSNMSLSLMLP